MWLLVPLGLILATSPASAQAPAVTVFPECEIDLSVISGLPAGAEEFTGSSFVADTAELRCPGSAPGGALQLRCTEQLVGWTFGSRSTRDFRCELTDQDCPGITNPSTADANNRSLTVSADGLVELFCTRPSG